MPLFFFFDGLVLVRGVVDKVRQEQRVHAQRLTCAYLTYCVDADGYGGVGRAVVDEIARYVPHLCACESGEVSVCGAP